VSETDYTTIRSLSAGSWFGKRLFGGESTDTGGDLYTLEFRNKRMGRHVKLYVDCKAIDPSKVVSLLKKYELIDSAVFYGDC
jgi:hypothetical protein